MNWGVHRVELDDVKWPRRGIFIERNGRFLESVALVLAFSSWFVRSYLFDYGHKTAPGRMVYWTRLSLDVNPKFRLEFRRGRTPMEES